MVQGRAIARTNPWFALGLALALTLFFVRCRRKHGWSVLAAVHIASFSAIVSCPVIVQAFAPFSLDLAGPLAAQLGCLAVAIGLDLRAKARELLKHKLEAFRQQALTAAVMRDSSDGIVITNEDGWIAVMNDRAAELMGVQRGDYVGRPLTAVIGDFPLYPTDRVSDAPGKLAPADCFPVTTEYPVGEGDDARIVEIVGDWTSYRGLFGEDFKETTERYVFAYTLRDISARKRLDDANEEAKAAALAASRAKTELLANMNHELRTPLNAIIGFSDIFRNEMLGPPGTEDYKRYAEDIHDSGKRLLGVVNDVLEVARLDAGELETHMAPLELGGLVLEHVETCERRLAAAGKRVTTDIDEAATARADESLLGRAVGHLLSNAEKFTREGDEIVVTVAAGAGGCAEVIVRDTGQGVDPGELSKLTSAFYQADGALTRSHEGAGLGLYLVAKCAELHGGSLALDSEPGAFFEARLSLPAAGPAATAAGAAQKAA